MSLKKDKLIKYSFIVVAIICFVFYQTKHREPISNISNQNNVKAAIITHHLLAKDLIEDLGKRISNNHKIKKVFIIGPNHDEVGKGPIITDSNQFKKNNIVKDDKTLSNDHSCWAPKSILKKYLLNSEISCILISSQADIVDLQELAKELSVNSEETLVIISTDFSHYLTKEQADKNDLITQQLIEQRDINSILRLNNDFVDSPKSLAFLFFYLKNISDTNMEIINHQNSAQILNQPNLDSTTSYFEIMFF